MSLIDEGTQTHRFKTNEGDHDRFAHYAKKGDITRATIEGGQILAICGVRFEPIRDPKRFPICPDCKRIKESR